MLAGGVLGAVATILFTIGTSTEISSFLDGPHTVDRADDIGDSSVLVAAQLIGIPGTQAIGLASLGLGLGWVVICLNAMRIGLLTRFMGVLGIICGALIVLPILSPLPIVQTFWLGAMALLLAGPLAQRRAARVADRRGGAVAELGRDARCSAGRRWASAAAAAPPSRSPDPEPADGARRAASTAASKKKKRKRRA